MGEGAEGKRQRDDRGAVWNTDSRGCPARNLATRGPERSHPAASALQRLRTAASAAAPPGTRARRTLSRAEELLDDGVKLRLVRHPGPVRSPALCGGTEPASQSRR